MEIQEKEYTGTNAKKINNSNSSKGEGILKSETGDKNIPNLEENKETLEKHEIENTPFVTIGNEEQGYWLTMGKYRLSEPYKTKEDVENYANENSNWQLLGNFITAIMHNYEEQKGLTK